VLAKASDDDYDTEWVDESGGTSEIFWATYDVTTSAEIEAAYQAGKMVCFEYLTIVYTLCRRSSETIHDFMSLSSSSSVRYAMCSNNSWSISATSIPAAATAKPSNLGTAAVGSSSKYAKEDHVHKMPTPADIGAGTYSKPSGGIPKTDLAGAVQTSLNKADTALQSVPNTYRTAAAQDTIDSGKLDIAQGAANAGKFMVVGSDGNITAVTMQTWQGGSY
jgi:hypothetical protein